MLSTDLLGAAEAAWLLHLAKVVTDAGYAFIHFPTQTMFNDGITKPTGSENFFVLRPIMKWGEGEDSGTLQADLQVVVVSPQATGDVLAGHIKNREMQALIIDALYSPEREAIGASMGGELYTLPLLQYASDGSYTGEIEGRALYYGRADFIDQTPLESSTRFWVMQVTVVIV